MPTRKTRASATADAVSSVIIKNMREMSAFDENGHVVQPVLDKWYEDHCLGRRRRKSIVTGRLEEYYTKNTRHSFNAMEHRGRMTRRDPKEKFETPRRWNDVKQLTRRVMMLEALKHDGTPHWKFTFYIGANLVENCLASKKPLAGYINKRIVRNLKQVLGDVEFGLWFHIEPTPEKPVERPPYHAHGILYIEDESWLIRRRVRYKSVREALWTATGLDGTMSSKKWLDLQREEMNTGWLRYCIESRNDRRWWIHDYLICPEEVGRPLSAMTHTMRRKTRSFYERMLPLMRAIAADRYEDFSADDWEELNQGYPESWLHCIAAE